MNAERKITLTKALSAATAILFADTVSDDVREERAAICNACGHKRTDRAGIAFCGLCGCSVSSNKTSLVNLCRYVENLPKWGCKHPQRDLGGWKR